jgi:hypothetical protein
MAKGMLEKCAVQGGISVSTVPSRCQKIVNILKIVKIKKNP